MSKVVKILRGIQIWFSSIKQSHFKLQLLCTRFLLWFAFLRERVFWVRVKSVSLWIYFSVTDDRQRRYSLNETSSRIHFYSTSTKFLLKMIINKIQFTLTLFYKNRMIYETKVAKRKKDWTTVENSYICL